jgi:RNA polymerase-binding transcription factor DksA
MKHISRRQTAPRVPAHASLARFFARESRKLRKAIQRQMELIKYPGTTRGEILDEAAEISEQAKDIAVLERLEEELTAVTDAQKRIAEGKYGICETCQKPIPRGRLQALPYATRCIACQTEYEQLTGHHRPRHLALSPV